MNPTAGLAGEVRVGFGKRSGRDLLGVRDGRLVLRCFRTYTFAAEEVVAVERLASIWFDAGVRIVHGRADYPRQMRFRCRDGSDAVFRLLERSGFAPRGTVPAGRSSLWPWARGLGVLLVVYAISQLLFNQLLFRWLA